jgi:selenide,water dikinase
LCDLPFNKDPRLLIGIETAADAGIYKLTDKIALVQTVDFLTPMVDDPFYFGQIAAANSLSDVYAMGGKPLTAMNLIGFPVRNLDLSVLKTIIKGGLDKLHEAGAVLVGGHSTDDQELKYGLSVTGLVSPDKIWSNSGARDGDKIILTKPIGVGVLNTAIKANMASGEEIKIGIQVMAHLNQTSSETMAEVGGVNACTDVTGFGLIGHLYNICRNSHVSAKLYSNKIPLIDGAQNYCQMGLLPAGAHANRQFYQSHVYIETNISDAFLDLLYDPQTSGGLLASIDSERLAVLLNRFADKGESWCTVIGEISSSGEEIILE